MVHIISIIHIPARIRKLQRIVQHIAVFIVVLCIGGVLQNGIRTQKSSDYGVVYPSVHVDQCKLIQVFVAGVAAAGVGGCGHTGVGPVGGVAAAAITPSRINVYLR
ncbi:hypothetical protein DSECCO2_627290 [anaerobic digester metagenome]